MNYQIVVLRKREVKVIKENPGNMIKTKNKKKGNQSIKIKVLNL